MFRKLDREDMRKLSDSLRKYGDRFLFFINDLKDYENNENIEVYSSGKLHILLFPYSLILASESDWTCSIEDRMFISKSRKKIIMGPENTMLPLIPYLSGYSLELRNMMTITPDDFIKKERDNRLKVLRTEPDFISLFQLYRKVPEMMEGFSEADDEINANQFISKPFPFSAVALFENNEALSGAYISNPERSNAMISGVATAPGYRGKGYAASVVSELVDIALNENRMKRISLWYTDENAGRIYRSLGFKDIGSWLYLKEE